jgi:hypothetical protein
LERPIIGNMAKIRVIDTKEAKLALQMLGLMVLIGLSAGYYSDDQALNQTRNISFSFEQSVSGSGYFMNDINAVARNVAMKNYAHGSGSIDNEAVMNTYSYRSNSHPIAEDWVDYNQSCIQFQENNLMTYAPINIDLGGFAARPLEYSSLLKEKTWIKNYRAASSIHHEIEYAHAINKDLEIVAKENFKHSYDPTWEGQGSTQMRINEDVTEGKIHLGILQGSETGVANLAVGDPASYPFKCIWIKPAVMVDEDYWGTYHLQKNVSLDVPYYKKDTSDDWLPCCFQGYFTMP